MMAFTSNVCSTSTALETYVRDYRGCIVEKAQAFEVNGDTAESVAMAAIQACIEYRQRIEDHVNLCGGANGASGAEVMEQAAQEYHDFAVETVMKRRAQRKADELKLGLPR